MNQNTSIKDKALAASLALLAIAIIYFAYALLSVSKQIPAIVDQVSHLTKLVDQTAQNVEPVLESLPDLMKSVDQTTALIPDILAEVGKVRALVPHVLSETEAIRLTVPELLARVDSIEAQISSLQKDLPAVLATVDNAAASVHGVNQSVDKITPLVPEVLSEVEKTRQDIPVYLSRLEGMIENAKGMTEDVGKNAVSGLVKGIVYSPIELLKGSENRLLGTLKNKAMLTEQDLAMANNASNILLSSNNATSQSWDNSQSGNKGQASITRTFTRNSQPCKTLEIVFIYRNEKTETQTKDICYSESGQWEIVE
ncbi:MAG: hypothetical protein H6998_00435 [Hahellaceae bacterium]|jgi:ABC-type transporter Mla subunit MlaD|nr:hypothetical protein [Hahellaceae bacterium]